MTANPFVYRPSCVVNLTLRFDESYQVIVLPPPQSNEDLIEQGLVAGPPAPTTLKPLIVDGAPLPPGVAGPVNTASNLTQIAARVPKRATVEHSGFRVASTFNLTFAFRDLPIDPRLIRSCGVEIHMGTVADGDFASGMVFQDPTTGQRSSIISPFDALGGPNLETLQLAGLVDKWGVEHGAKGGEIHLEGRDLRGYLLDAKIPPRIYKKLKLDAPIDEVVTGILGYHVHGAMFQVQINPDDWVDQSGNPIPIPSPAVKGDLTRPRLGASGAETNAKPAGDTDTLNYWDLITRYCFLVGAIPYMDGYTLKIRPVRSIYDIEKRSGFDPAFPTPFLSQRTDEDGGELRWRRLVYGRDVESLHFERKFGGVKGKVVECVSIDTSATSAAKKPDGKSQRLITGRWPQKSDQKASAGSVAPSGKPAPSEDVMRIPVPGIKSAQRLTEIARDIHEEIMRGDVSGSAGTKDLSSFGGDNSDPDMLSLRPGDPLEILTDTRPLSSNAPLVSELVDNARGFDEDLAEKYTQILGDRNLARVLVATARGAVPQLRTPFRVTNVKLDWDTGKMAVNFDFQNYIESRYTASNPTTADNKSRPKKSRAGA